MDIENFLARNGESSIRQMGTFTVRFYFAPSRCLVDKLPQSGKASLVGKAKRRKLRVVLREYPAMQ